MPCLSCGYNSEKGEHLPGISDSVSGVYICIECNSRMKVVESFGLTIRELKEAARAYRIAYWAMYEFEKIIPG